jgi:glycosyltransferase involved in cell wall biosynthesis
MADRPAALVLAPECPYPVIGGGPLRTASLIEYLSQKYEIDLVVFQQPDQPAPQNATVVPLRYHSRSAPARVLRNVSRFVRGVPPLNDRFAGYELPVRSRRYDLGVIEHFWCAGYASSLQCDRVWLNLHNIESVLYRSGARGFVAPLMHRFASSSLKLERELLPKFAGILVASETDAERVRQIAPACRPIVYPNTIPGVPVQSRVKRNEIVFSGNLEYEPNRDGVQYFRQEIWPLLRNFNVTWRLIGRNPEGVRGLVKGDPRIELSGPVDDAIAEIAAAQVAVVPLRSGSGTRVKIIEAWAAGTPVVATSIGAEGLPYRAGEHLLIADSPESFASAVIRVLESPGKARALAEAGRALYERELTWESAWKALSQVGL